MTTPLLFAGRSGWRCGNAGDEFSAPMLEHILGQPIKVMAEAENANIAAAGSILHQLGHDWAGLVWGSGLIREEDRAVCGRAKPLALRGPLTAARWGDGIETTYGDPGVLVANYWRRATEKRYKVGFVPHYVDAEDQNVTAIARRNSGEVATIDICGRVQDVLRGISECKYILSSSLHGVIFADAYGIPAAWVQLSDKLVGGSFKFRDYRAGLGMFADWVPAKLTGHERVEDLVDMAKAGAHDRAERIEASAAGLLKALDPIREMVL